MDIKITNSTSNRPEGERILDAPYVNTSLDVVIHQLKNEEGWKKNKRHSITLFKSPEVTIVMVGLHGGATIDDNEVSGLLSAVVLKGRVRLVTDQNEAYNIDELSLFTVHRQYHHVIEAK